VLNFTWFVAWSMSELRPFDFLLYSYLGGFLCCNGGNSAFVTITFFVAFLVENTGFSASLRCENGLEAAKLLIVL